MLSTISQAIELLEIALLLFQSELGADHPRCHVAARNMARAERKALGLHLPGTKDPKMIPRKSSRPLKLFPLHQKAQQYDHQIRQSIAAALEDEKKKGPRESLESPVSGRVSRKSTNHPSTESGKSPERRMSQAPERRTSEAPDKRMSQMPERNPLVQLLERRMSEAPGRRASEVVEARGVEPGADVAPSWIDASAPNWLVDGRRQSSTQRPGTPDAATFLRQNSSVRQESVAGNLPPIASPRVSTSGTPVAKLEAPQGTGRVSRAEKSTGSVGVKSETSVGRFRIRRFGGSSFR